MSDSENHRVPRVAVVMGASSGIGRATALKLSEKFDHLVLHAATNLVGLQSLADELKLLNTRSLCVLHDLSRSGMDESIIESAFRWQGHVDAWVHAAGADVLTTRWKERPFERKLDRLWEVDVRSSICMARNVAMKMSKQSTKSDESEEVELPSIVLIGWDQAEQGMEGESGIFFAATKAAVMAATRSLSRTYGPSVRVNCVAPGWIQTAWGENASPSWQQRAVGESSLGRWGTPQDVAETIAFLCSKNAEFINGQIVRVNGGWQPSRSTLG